MEEVGYVGNFGNRVHHLVSRSFWISFTDGAASTSVDNLFQGGTTCSPNSCQWRWVKFIVSPMKPSLGQRVGVTLDGEFYTCHGDSTQQNRNPGDV